MGLRLWVGLQSRGKFGECCSIIFTQSKILICGDGHPSLLPSRSSLYLLNICIKRVINMRIEGRRRMILTVISWNTYT